MTDSDLARVRDFSLAQRAGAMQAVLRRLPIETCVIAFTVALWTAVSVATPNFLTENNISNLMRGTPIAVIVAIGEMCTIVIAGIDLSVGSVVAFCGVAFAQMCRHGLHLAPAAALTLMAGVGIGLTNAAAIGRLGIPPFIITLAGLQVYRGLALLLAGGMTVGGLPSEGKDFARGTTGLPIFSGQCWPSQSRSIICFASRAPDAISMRWVRTPRPRAGKASIPFALHWSLMG